MGVRIRVIDKLIYGFFFVLVSIQCSDYTSLVRSSGTLRPVPRLWSGLGCHRCVWSVGSCPKRAAVQPSGRQSLIGTNPGQASPFFCRWTSSVSLPLNTVQVVAIFLDDHLVSEAAIIYWQSYSYHFIIFIAFISSLGSITFLISGVFSHFLVFHPAFWKTTYVHLPHYFLLLYFGSFSSFTLI